MARKEKIELNKFSLIVRNSKIKRIIPIPEIKKGLKRRTVGGKVTFQMAIDAFTTQFPNKEALLKYAIENNLVSLPNSNYDNLYVEVEYRGKGEYNGNHQVLYNDQKELIDFINNNEIKGYFSHENPYTNDFEQTIIKYWTSGMYQVEYKMFMTDYKNGYFGLDLTDTLNKMKKENLMDKVKNKESHIGPVCHYHNLRGYFMTINNLEEILFKITREKIWSYQDRIEYEREERLEKMQERQSSSIKLDIVKFPETKTQIAEEQLPKQNIFYEDSLFYEKEETPKQR